MCPAFSHCLASFWATETAARTSHKHGHQLEPSCTPGKALRRPSNQFRPVPCSQLRAAVLHGGVRRNTIIPDLIHHRSTGWLLLHPNKLLTFMTTMYHGPINSDINSNRFSSSGTPLAILTFMAPKSRNRLADLNSLDLVLHV